MMDLRADPDQKAVVETPTDKPRKPGKPRPPRRQRADRAKTKAMPATPPRRSRQSTRLGRLLRRMRRQPLAMAGLVIVGAFVALAVCAPLIAPFNPYAQDHDLRLAAPDGTFLFGTDELGRDILSRLIYGARFTLGVVVVVVVLAAPIGLVLGCLAGYFGGWIDALIMRVTDVFLAFPRLVLALALVAALGPGLFNAVIAIALTAWPVYARVARAESMLVREADYVSAARLQGAGSGRIVFGQVMPMCLNSLTVRVTFDMAGIILTAAGLGFLGLGALPPSPEWGAMISAGRDYLYDQWWVATVPGVAILVVSLGFNLLGDGLREILDPKS